MLRFCPVLSVNCEPTYGPELGWALTKLYSCLNHMFLFKSTFLSVNLHSRTRIIFNHKNDVVILVLRSEIAHWYLIKIPSMFLLRYLKSPYPPVKSWSHIHFNIIPVCTAQGGGGSFKERKPIGGWLLWITDRRANEPMDREAVGGSAVEL